MRKYQTLWVALLLAALAPATGCDDPADPRTWAKQLGNLRTQKEALDNLARMPVEKARLALPELTKLFNDTRKPEHLRAIARLQDPSSKKLFVDQLDFSADDFEAATIAAGFLSDMKAADTVDDLGKVAERKLPIKSRANSVRLTAIRALASIGDRKATPYLVNVLTASADEQDFLLNKSAALALAELADPASVPALLKGLFMTGRGANTFQEARLGLVRVGEPAVEPLIALFERKDKDIELMGRQQSFADNGIIPYKASYLLGDLRAAKAVAVLKAGLGRPQKGGEHTSIMIALGQIGTPEAVDTLIEAVKNDKLEPSVRASASNGLYMSGDKRAVPTLLEIAKSGFVMIEGQKASDLRASAAIDLARIAGKEHYAAFKALADAETDAAGLFGEALDRMQVADKCDTDLKCYGATLADSSWTRAEKAVFALGFSNEPKTALPLLLGALKPLASLSHDRFPVHQALMFALQRLGDKSCKECVEKLEQQIEKDEKNALRIPGARDLLGETRVTLARIKNR